MNSRRYVLTLISLGIIPLLLFHFQNCAPAGKIEVTSVDAGHVQLIDNFDKSQIQFVSPESEIQDEAPSVDISGMCTREHNGAKLRWSVSAGEAGGRPVVSGETSCSSGQFAVELEQLEQYPCGVDHLLVVESDWGASTSTRFSRHCQPLASRTIAAPAGSPVGTTCTLEYSPASAAEQRCVQICYRSSQVVYSQTLDVNQCSSLAAGLAGP